MKTEPTHPKNLPPAVSRAAHRLLLLYFGVLATAIEESYALAHRLMEQRELSEKEGHRRVNRVLERSKARLQAAAEDGSQAGDSLPGRMVPATKTDLAALDAKIARLSQKIDEIRKP